MTGTGEVGLPVPSLAGLLLLADGRLPTGGHAHSGGVEPAVAEGRVTDLASLHGYLVGRLATTAEVDAAFAVAARRWAAAGADLATGLTLDAELAARTPSPALRRAGRAQGRGLRRAAARCWPSPALDAVGAVHPDGPMWAMALGAAAEAAALDDRLTALVARWSAVTGPAWAAVRLLGLDPMAVAALLAELTGGLDAAALPEGLEGGAAGGSAEVGHDRLPALSTLSTLSALSALGAPLAELRAEDHATWEVRLFAS